MSNSAPAILAENLTRRFGARLAVDHVSFQVERGDVFGFLGPNGAGKTTTIGMLLRLVRPGDGHAQIFGHDVWREPEAALQRVGGMIEIPALYPYLSGRDNLRVLARVQSLPDKRVDEVLALVDLADRARDRAGTYSQGMKQRLAVAGTLLANPDLILLDEPTNGLDPEGMVDMRRLITRLAAEGHTVFLCSHMLHEVQQVCNRLAILKAGRIVAEGRVEELLQRGQGIEVRIEGDTSPALVLLKALPWITAVHSEGGMLVLDAPSERTAEVNTYLAQHGCAVAEIRARSYDLERFFLDTVGGNADATLTPG